MTKIILADDHHLFNDGLKLMLSNNFIVLKQVFHGHDVMPAIIQHKPDLVILDINMPGINGLDIGKQIKKDYPKIKIVFLSMYQESNFIQAAKNLGAEGYLLKDSSSEEIIASLHKVVAGVKVYKEELASVNLHHEDFFVKNFALSNREVEVIKHIKNGLNTEEIADTLCLSYETIKTHRKNIFFKLNISKASELITFAVKYGI
jgi:DNA-binding NarL/FixJ family response regulator